MLHAYAHEACLIMDLGEDLGAPGAAITVALCGHWDHEPPCPLAPHHTRADRVGDEVRVRTLFVAEPEVEETVRTRIEGALARGELSGPGGGQTRWTVRSSHRAEVAAGETEHAARLMRS